MCDYSLEAVKSREAKVGDQLITADFGTVTRGFADPAFPGLAVCLRPGTELAFGGPVHWVQLYGVRATVEQPRPVARFRKINVQDPRFHHDALEFSTGETIQLTKLIAGQWASVLQLPNEHETKTIYEVASPYARALTEEMG